MNDEQTRQPGTEEDPLAHPQVVNFTAYLQLKNLAPATIFQYRQVLGWLFEYVDLQTAPPCQIDSAQLRAYVASLHERGLAASTIKTRVVAIKEFFCFLMEERIIREDPAEGLPYPKVGKRLPRALKMSQVKDLFAVMGGPSPLERRDRVFFELLYTCGLRIGEAVRLRVRDVNWDDGRLRVVGKGNKERRAYLKPYVEARLREYVAQAHLADYLFPGQAGHISTGTMRARFKTYVHRAGLPDETSPHTLRHSVAVHYLMGGAPISFVQRLLGHESLETTGIYTQLVDDVARAITLTTENALYQKRETRDEVREPPVAYASDADGGDDFVALVLPWLAEPS